MRDCPNLRQEGKGKGNWATVNAVATELLTSANHYNRGGTKLLSCAELHEQMDDPDMEQDGELICHLAIEFATRLIAGGMVGGYEKLQAEVYCQAKGTRVTNDKGTIHSGGTGNRISEPVNDNDNTPMDQTISSAASAAQAANSANSSSSSPVNSLSKGQYQMFVLTEH